MHDYIYADVVFAVNFFMDLFILYATGKICGKKTVFWRLVSAALLGAALYCLLLFLPALFKYYNFFTVTFIAVLPAIYAAFLPKTMKEFARLAITAYLSAFAIGGGAMALFYTINSNNINIFGSATRFNGKNFSIYILAAATFLSYFCLKFIQVMRRRLVMTKQSFCTVKIYYGDTYTELNALVDTGNTLVEPISKKPVIIAEFSSLEKCLPLYVRQIFEENKQNDLNSILGYVDGTPFAQRLRMIPVKTVGSKSVLVGFRPDKVEIHMDKSVSCENAIVGICNMSLTGNCQYNALVNPKLISKDNANIGNGED